VPGTRSALFVDWGGTLALTENNRTVVDRDGHPVLMPNVAATLSRVTDSGPRGTNPR